MTTMTYARYLHLTELLSLQQPLTPSSEPNVRDSERLFITVHQASETLLSQALTDLRYVSENRCGEDRFGCRVMRATLLVDALEGHLRLLRNTLRRQDFLDFRDRLGTASGLQSPQFHELFALTATLTSDDRRGPLDGLRDAVARWRRTHLELVAHMIGGGPGTGSTSGAGYLADALHDFENRAADEWSGHNGH